MFAQAGYMLHNVGQHVKQIQKAFNRFTGLHLILLDFDEQATLITTMPVASCFPKNCCSSHSVPCRIMWILNEETAR